MPNIPKFIGVSELPSEVPTSGFGCVGTNLASRSTVYMELGWLEVSKYIREIFLRLRKISLIISIYEEKAKL